MTKYSSVSQRRVPPPIRPHPVWRGIGCLLTLIVPIMSYALAVLSVKIAVDRNWPMPYQWMGYPVMPVTLWKVVGLAPLLIFIQSQNNLYVVLAFTFFYIVVFGAVVSLGYAVLYKFVGPPRYGPQDAPPPKFKVKRYKR